jgi:hypothetical protein
LSELSDALSLTAIDDPIVVDDVLADPTTQIEHDRGQPTKFVLRFAAALDVTSIAVE